MTSRALWWYSLAGKAFSEAFGSLRVDGTGRVFCTAGDGAQAFRPDGTLIGKFLTAQAANCCLGGLSGCELVSTTTSSVWSVLLPGRPR